jgi:hypothetical protein
MRQLGWLLSAAALSLTACGETTSPPGNGDPMPGRPDAGAPDSGTPGTGGPGDPNTPPEPQGSARIPAYLKASPYTRLVLEVDSSEGFSPRAGVETAVVDTLRAVVAKPGGVSVTRDQTLPRKGSTYEWTQSELFQLADSTFTLPRAGDTVRMHVMFLDGQFNGGQVLGLAWSSTHLVVFKETIERQCRSGLGATLGERVCEAAEQGVWVHELGHLLGLVNNGLPMAAPHQDADHPGHDSNDGCVMFWAFDTSSSLDKVARQLLGGEAVNLQFDDACKADLAAGRGVP